MLSWVFYDFLDQTLMHSWSKFGSRIVVGKLYCNHNPFELCMKNSLIKPSCWVLIKTWVSSHTSLQFCSILVNFLTCFCSADTSVESWHFFYVFRGKDPLFPELWAEYRTKTMISPLCGEMSMCTTSSTAWFNLVIAILLVWLQWFMRSSHWVLKGHKL